MTLPCNPHTDGDLPHLGSFEEIKENRFLFIFLLKKVESVLSLVVTLNYVDCFISLWKVTL